ncbi:Lipase-like abhydrolase domain-containing protein [Sarcoptes scabiei]|uniref:Lipase-like abhydrolase domain-containing protein n=1 Tax=Sarcoptes scabiei TaxID=52283 RepID=A0A132AFT6_SARSC|nr:Lipase-like abhydrolase domain-containing protein [Sarcoptes scabiei]
MLSNGSLLERSELNANFRWIKINANNIDSIRMNGFEAKNHTVITADSYLIRIFQIINPKRQTSHNGYPIVLFTGLLQESHSFLENTDGWFNQTTGLYSEFENRFRNRLDIVCKPNRLPDRFGRNIAFTLAACGFDVWLANVRDDTRHSSHLYLNPQTDPLFWNITLDHYTIDSEAIIDYVLEQSKSETLGVFCFSVSCNSLHQLMAEHQRFNRLIRPLFQIAPFIFIHEIASLPLMINIGLEPIYRNLLQSTPNFDSILPWIANETDQNRFVRSIVLSGLFSLSGLNLRESVPERFYRKISHFPSIASLRVMAHIGQRFHTKELYKFDYGVEENLRIYGQQKPPIYDSKRITNPTMVLWHGTEDFIADTADIERLKQSLSVSYMETFTLNYGHLDFFYAKSMNITITRPILMVLDRLKLNYN